MEAASRCVGGGSSNWRLRRAKVNAANLRSAAGDSCWLFAEQQGKGSRRHRLNKQQQESREPISHQQRLIRPRQIRRQRLRLFRAQLLWLLLPLSLLLVVRLASCWRQELQLAIAPEQTQHDKRQQHQLKQAERKASYALDEISFLTEAAASRTLSPSNQTHMLISAQRLTMTSAEDTAVSSVAATNSAANATANSSSPPPPSADHPSELNMQFPLYMRILATIACVVIFTIGVCGNLLVPLVVIKTKYLRNSTNLFLINLSVADLLVLIVCMPTVLIELHSKPETWLLGVTMCKVSNYVEILAANGSIFTILAISFERYYAICKPLKAGYKCTRLRATIIICLIWLLSSVLSSPTISMAKSTQTTYIDGSLVYNCILETNTYWHKAYVFVSMFAFFCLPLLVLMLVYWLIGRRLFRENISAKGTTISLATSDSIENNTHTTATGGSSSFLAILATNFRRISFRNVPPLAKRPLATFFTSTTGGNGGRQHPPRQHSSQLSRPQLSETQEEQQQLAPAGKLLPKLGGANCGCNNNKQAGPLGGCCNRTAAGSVSAAKPKLAALQKAFSLDHQQLFSGSGGQADKPGSLEQESRRAGAPCGNQLTSVHALRTPSSPGRVVAAAEESSKRCKGSDCQPENNDLPSETSLAKQFVYQLLHIKLNTTPSKAKDTRRRGERNGNCNKANYADSFGETPAKSSNNNGSGSNCCHHGGTISCCSANSSLASPPLPPALATTTMNSCFTPGSEPSCSEEQSSQVPFLPANSYRAEGGRANSGNSARQTTLRNNPSEGAGDEAEEKRKTLVVRANKGNLEISIGANRKSRPKFTWSMCTNRSSSGSSSSSAASSSSSPSSSPPPPLPSPTSVSAAWEARGEGHADVTAAPATSNDLTSVVSTNQIPQSSVTSHRSQLQQKQQPRPIIHCNGSNRKNNWRQRYPSERKKFAHFSITLDETSTAGYSPMSNLTPPLLASLSPLPSQSPPLLLLQPIKPDTPASKISSLLPFGSSKSSSPESAGFERETPKVQHGISTVSGRSGGVGKGVGHSTGAESKRGCQRLSQVNDNRAQTFQTTTAVKRSKEPDGNPNQRESSPGTIENFCEIAGRSGSVATTTSITGCDNRVQAFDERIGHHQLKGCSEELRQTADINNLANNKNNSSSFNSIISGNNNNDTNNYKSEKFKSVLPMTKRKSLDKLTSSDHGHNHQHHHFHFSLRRSCKNRSGSQPMICSHFQQQQQGGNGQLSELLVVQDLSKKQQMESRRQVVLMLAFVVACFFLLFFPYRLFTIWLILSTDDQIAALGMETYYNLTYFSRILIYLHSAINPIAYNLISTKFRRAFTSILLCRGSSTRRQFTTEHRILNNKVINHDQRRSLHSSTLTSPSSEVFK